MCLAEVNNGESKKASKKGTASSETCDAPVGAGVSTHRT
jgi:hypothetical protein